jgi:hypothetical protein
MNDGEGAGAGRTLKVFKLIDSDLGAGGRLDHRGVTEAVSLTRRGRVLGGGTEARKDEERGGEIEGSSGEAVHRS